MVSGKDKALALTAHIGYVFFGLGYVVAPLIIYLFFDGKNAFVSEHARQAFIVQAIVGIVGAVVSALTAILVGVLLWPIAIIVSVVWVVCSVMACFKVINGEAYHYPLLG